MLASELAHELGIDPSVISKRLNTYHAERGTPHQRRLEEETVAHLRQADALLRSGKARNFREAVQHTLGRYTPPVPSESAQEILQRLEKLEAQLTRIDETVTWIKEFIQARNPNTPTAPGSVAGNRGTT